jgi:hypothetical protein
LDGALGMAVGMSMIITMMMISFDLYCEANIEDYGLYMCFKLISFHFGES